MRCSNIMCLGATLNRHNTETGVPPPILSYNFVGVHCISNFSLESKQMLSPNLYVHFPILEAQSIIPLCIIN